MTDKYFKTLRSTRKKKMMKTDKRKERKLYSAKLCIYTDGKCEKCLQKQYLDNGFCVLYCTGFSPICIIIIIVIIITILIRFVLKELSHVTLRDVDEKVAVITINNRHKFPA